MPPIFVSDFCWSDNDNFVNIRIKWPSPCCKADILTYNNYLKISSSPFLFELFLAFDIDENASKCYRINDEYVFELKKAQPGLWDHLERKLEKNEKVSCRKEVEHLKQIANADLVEQKKTQKRARQNIAVQEQIGLDSQNVKVIEDIKSKEKNIATKSIEAFKKSAIVPSRKEKISPRKSDTLSKPLDPIKSREFPIPLIRQPGKIEVHFSEREFPTPTRESLLEEEKEFLAKQLAARRATGFVSEDLRPEECNPVWLKNKGDEFHKNKNYLGAVSAYSHAIKIGATLPAIYSNRSASHMELGNLHKALEDCSTALELLTPHVPANAEARARAHARRATILCRLGAPEKSLAEFEEALKLRPTDEQLRIDFERAKLSVEENEDSDT